MSVCIIILFFRCAADSVFELTSICMNVAIWYTKYAAKLAAKGEYVLWFTAITFQQYSDMNAWAV